jgi:Cu/Ag efflux protein CusF
MKKATVIFLALLFVFAITSLSFAAEQTKSEQMPVEKTKVKQIRGEIVKLDTKAGTLSVKSKRQEVALLTDSSTIVLIGKEKKTLADLKIGDRVKAKYIQADGNNMAKSISVMEEKNAPAK